MVYSSVQVLATQRRLGTQKDCWIKMENSSFQAAIFQVLHMWKLSIRLHPFLAKKSQEQADKMAEDWYKRAEMAVGAAQFRRIQPYHFEPVCGTYRCNTMLRCYSPPFARTLAMTEGRERRWWTCQRSTDTSAKRRFQGGVSILHISVEAINIING